MCDVADIYEAINVCKLNNNNRIVLLHTTSLYPTIYKDVNLHGTEILMKVMEENHCYSIIFSSSATVYGENDEE